MNTRLVGVKNIYSIDKITIFYFNPHVTLTIKNTDIFFLFKNIFKDK